MILQGDDNSTVATATNHLQCSKKRKLEDIDGSQVEDGNNVPDVSSAAPESMEIDVNSSSPTNGQISKGDNGKNGQISKGDNGKNGSKDKMMTKSCLTAMPLMRQAGHTGYLTFCVVPPLLPRPVNIIHINKENDPEL